MSGVPLLVCLPALPRLTFLPDPRLTALAPRRPALLMGRNIFYILPDLSSSNSFVFQGLACILARALLNRDAGHKWLLDT